MRVFRMLPLLSIAVMCPAVAQTIAETKKSVLPVAQDDSRVVARPSAKTGCPEYLEGCLREDKSRALLLLGLMSTGKRPLVLR